MSAIPAYPASGPAPAPTGPTDEALVRKLRDGDAHAGEMLVERHHRALLRYLQRLAGNEHLAEELHQQTWISVLEHLDRFDPRGSPGGFKAWIFRIATNKANDLWRSRGREKAAHAGLRLVSDDELPHAGARIEDTEQHGRLKQAIEQLPDAQKQVLMLRYYSGLKFNEIAEVVGCPLNTALGRMHKAVLKLRELLNDDGAPARTRS
ncbi:MAG TPA: sigma-70 family RNA polymerase sigma factor [Tepidisphaeraceae bacterium]|nr:sigma-70 family RNA polymerase sigma factor [Tepidisphaeraceae bacterium]